METAAFSERKYADTDADIGFGTVSEKSRQLFSERCAQLQEHKPHRDDSLDDVKTVGIIGELGLEKSAAGWLVCTEGAVRGRDFTLKCGRNILSAYPGLEGINPDTSVVFNYRNNSFIFFAGSSQAMINGNEIYGTVELKKSDVIELCGYKLVFVPFCEGDFKW